MNRKRTIPIAATAPAPAARRPEERPVEGGWHPRHLLLAPHRLGFFLAMVVLVASGAWWWAVQMARSTGWWGMYYAMAPSLVHAAVMVFGFIPLFFSGFLFTAGPKWLGVDALPAQALRAPLLLQAGGWLLWLSGGHWRIGASLVGLALATLGMAWMAAQYGGRIRASRAPDQVHARVVGAACVLGCASMAALGLSLAWGTHALSRAWVYTGLWGFVVVVYVTVAHRMIPFFTASAVPGVAAWRPMGLLWLMLAACALQVLAAWLDWAGVPVRTVGPPWTLVHGTLQLALGGLLVWLSLRWGLLQSLRNRLLAMLHIGFGWLGVAFVLGGLSPWLGWGLGIGTLGLGALHALTMGCLGSLMLAMVTRVSAGHSGRPLVADRIVWTLFWLLQLATLLRIGAALPGAFGVAWVWLLPASAALWALVTGLWALRLCSWYGRLRADGKPG